MKKIKIYFYKHGFQTDGVSLWVVERGKLKWFTRNIAIHLDNPKGQVRSKFSRRNPHAYFEVVYHKEIIFFNRTKAGHYIRIAIV